MAREMKYSGYPWIGTIPFSWEVCRIKNLTSVYTGNSIKDEQKEFYEDPTNAIPYIATKDIDATLQTIDYDNGMYVKKADTSFKRADAQSTLLCIEGGSAGKKIAYTEKDVCFVNKLCCFHSQTNSNKYIYYYLMSPAFTQKFKSHISGLIGGVSVSEINNFEITQPSISEQNRIVEYLDKKCAEIDAMVNTTRVSIEDYKSLKISVITKAVTKGLSIRCPMKDSGIDWIGDIPENWTVLRKLSYAVNKNISYGIVKLFDPDDENGVKVLRCSDVREGKIDTTNIRTVTQEVSNEYSRTVLDGGEVLINVRGTLGGCAVVPPEMKGYNIAREVAMVSLSEQILNRYLMYYFLSRAFITYEERHLAGSVYIGLNIEMLSACPITLPPIEEQKQIAEYLDKTIGDINNLIAKKEKLLEELEQYKKSIIFEYVTGKKEVPA